MVEVERAGHSKGDPRRLWQIVQGWTAAALGGLLFFSEVQWGSRGFPGGSDGKESACSAGDPGSIPGSGRSAGEGNGNPL